MLVSSQVDFYCGRANDAGEAQRSEENKDIITVKRIGVNAGGGRDSNDNDIDMGRLAWREI